MARSGKVGALPDLAWIVRPGENAELRYSLRSFAKNARGLYRKVWIVGTVPEWVKGVEGIPLTPLPEKFANIRQSLTALCADERAADEVVIMHDDFFAIDRVTDWRGYHLGSTAKFLARLAANGKRPEKNTWVRSLQQTAAWMAERGHGDIDCYEAHTPLLFDRRKLGALIAEYSADRWMLCAGLYPEAGAGGGERGINTKVSALDAATLEAKVAAPVPYLSSNEASFDGGVIGGFVRGVFRESCRFEK